MVSYMESATEDNNFLLEDPTFAELWAPNGILSSIHVFVRLADSLQGTLLGVGDTLYRRKYAE